MAGRKPYQTRAKKELLDYLKTAPGKHFTVAEIKEHFSGDNNPIGMATVYRQMERFVEEGTVRKFVLGPGERACYAFAGNQDCSSHFHCKCEVCGALIHMDCNELREIRDHLQDHYGFIWDAGKTVFYGICDQCRNT